MEYEVFIDAVSGDILARPYPDEDSPNNEMWPFGFMRTWP